MGPNCTDHPRVVLQWGSIGGDVGGGQKFAAVDVQKTSS